MSMGEDDAMVKVRKNWNSDQGSYIFDDSLTENQLLEKFLPYLEKNIQDSEIVFAVGDDKERISRIGTLHVTLKRKAAVPMDFKRNVWFGVHEETGEEVLGYSGYSIASCYDNSELSNEEVRLIGEIKDITRNFFENEIWW